MKGKLRFVTSREFDDGSLVIQPIDELDKLNTHKLLSENHKVVGLNFSNTFYWERRDINIVEQFKDITSLKLDIPLLKDVSALKHLKDLETLYLGERLSISIDLSHFPKLKNLFFHGDYKKLKNLNTCKKLTQIDCYKLRTSSKNFSVFPKLPKLKTIKVVICNFEDLDGINNFPNIEKIELYYFSKLKTLEGFEKLKKLNVLKISNAKRIEDYSPLGNCSSLKELTIENTSPIKDFRQILKNKNLNTLIFLGTDVIGGDMRPLLDRVWDYVTFTNKRHFSHKYTQIPAKQYVVNAQYAYPVKLGEPLEPWKEK